MKKILLALMGVLIGLPSFARDFQYDGLWYTVLDEEAKTVQTKEGDWRLGTPGNQVSGNIVLPETVYDEEGEAYTLKAIADCSFLNTTSITSITLPNSVETIGTAAFYKCKALRSITLSESLTKISSYAFNECRFLASVNLPPSLTEISWRAFYNCDGLRSIIIPPSVTTIGDEAFYGCRGLKKSAHPNTFEHIFDYVGIIEGTYDYIQYGSVITYDPEGSELENGILYGGNKTEVICAATTLEGECFLPETVKTIGNEAFEYCENLTLVSLPVALETIGENAFAGCTGLLSIAIPNKVTSIGTSAFNDCRGLQKVIWPNTLSNPFMGMGISVDLYYDAEEEYLFEKGWIWSTDKKIIVFVPCNLEGDYVVPDNVEQIYSYAFANCYALNSVIVPPSVTSIGASAFYYCSNLSSVDLPEGLTSIGGSTFYYCRNLSSVDLPEGLTSIGGCAFYNCRNLSSVDLPEGLTAIGEAAFKECSGLSIINSLSKTPPVISTDSFEGLYAKAEVIVPDLCLSNYMATNWVLFDNIRDENGLAAEKFSDDIFQYRISGENSAMLLPGNYSDMEVVSIPERIVYNDKFYYVTSLYDNAFKNCTKISKLVLPKRLATIGESAFEGANIDIADLSLPTTLATIKTNAFKNCSGISKVTLPEGLSHLGSYAFSGSSVAEINLPTSPQDYCFSDAKSLSSVSFSESVDSIGSYVFSGCEALQSISLPNSVSSIGESAFNNCTGLESVGIGNSINVIQKNAFNGCTALTKSEFTSIPSLCSIEFGSSSSNPIYYSKNLYVNGTEVKDLVIPNSVESIGKYSFYNCEGLNTVSINNSVKSIGLSAFDGCTALTKTEFASIPSLCSIEFGNSSSNPICYSMNLYINGTEVKDLVIPNSVESIGAYTFNNCEGITSVTIPESVKEIGTYAFGSCGGVTSIKIGNGLSQIPQSAFMDCSRLETITIEEGTSPISFEYDLHNYSKWGISVLNMGRNWEGELPIESEYLKTLNFGNTVTEIPENAFSGYSKLTSVTFGSSVETIGANAFKDCNLTELVLSPATTTIGEGAFEGNDLKNIALGANVTEIGANVFNGANSLEGVSITAVTPPSAQNTTFSYYDCPLYVVPSANDVVKDAYYNFTRCWYRFSGYDLIPIEEVKIEGPDSFSLEPGQTIKLTATYTPEDASLPYIYWYSTNPNIATVDKEGNVKMMAHNSGIDTLSDEAEEPCRIIAKTLYSDVPVAEVTITEVPTGVEEIEATDSFETVVRSNDIYTIQGVCVKVNATDEDVKALTPGLYIIAGKKVLVK